MAEVGVKAQVAIKGCGQSRLSAAQAVRLAECELATLKTWLAADPMTPHAKETGQRLMDLAQVLINHGSKG